MSSRPLALLWLALSLAPAARAQSDDEPIPYPGDEPVSPRRRNLPPISDPTYKPKEETEVEKQDRQVDLAFLDDPAVGWVVEAFGGVMLIESSRGAWFEPRLAGGARVTWELGRHFWSEVLRDGLFCDLGYTYSLLHDGTTLINEDTNFHYFTLAPAFGLPVGLGSDYIAYVQVGGGLVLQYSALHWGSARETQLMGLKPGFQYGIGLRGDPSISPDGKMRLSFRIELTRYLRQYMTDTFLGASVGAAF
jgi:hypothetical protein